MSSAILSSTWSLLLEEVDPKTKPGLVLPNSGCDGVAAPAEVNENMELEEEPEAMALLELKEWVSEEEELIPNASTEPKGLAIDANNTELPEEKVVSPASPNDEDDADEENWMGMLWVEVPMPVLAADAWVLTALKGLKPWVCVVDVM